MALVDYERDGRIVTLTLNRPEKLNAFSDELVGVLGYYTLISMTLSGERCSIVSESTWTRQRPNAGRPSAS